VRRKSSRVRHQNARWASKHFGSSLLARLARALERSKIPYLLTGADAVSYYGAPRRSDDKDLVVMTSDPEDLRRVVREFQKEGFEVKELEIGHNTLFDSGFRIDIKVKADLEKTKRVKLSRDLSLNLTTPENLVLMKLDFWDGESFEGNDAQDLMKIFARQRKNLDMGYVRTEATNRRIYDKLTKVQRYLSER